MNSSEHDLLREINKIVEQILSGEKIEFDLNKRNVSNSAELSSLLENLKHLAAQKDRISKTNIENEQLFNGLFDLSPDGMLISDLTGKIQYLSNAGKQMFGLEDKDIERGINLFGFVSDEDKDKALQNNKDRFAGKYSGFAEYRVVRKDGSKFWNETNAAILRDSSGNPRSLLVVFRDVTKRKEQENLVLRKTEELKESNAVKDKFFSIIGHDLKNPFNVITNISEIMLEEFNELSNPEKLDFLNAINESSKSASKLLSNLLEWSRAQAGLIEYSPEILQIKKIIENSIDLHQQIAANKKIKLHCKIPAGFITKADPNMLDTVVRNLISNAIKFTPQEGEVKVTAVESDNHFVISVSDTCTGISQEDLSKLFRLDVKNIEIGKSQEKGTGLGLILCKEFVERNNGKIWVESIEGIGSTFFFTLPQN